MSSDESVYFQEKDYYCERAERDVHLVLKITTKTHPRTGQSFVLSTVVHQCPMLETCGVMKKTGNSGTSSDWGKCDYRQKAGLNG